MRQIAEASSKPLKVGPDGPYLRVFGGVGVDVSGEPVSIGGPRQRRLLALLTVRSGSVVSNDWLAEYLWHDDDRPTEVERALRTYVSRLRSALPESARDWVETESSGYRLLAEPQLLEHKRFSTLRERARKARIAEDPQTALACLDEALALWRGDPFRELEDLDWAQADIEQLRLDRLEMQEERWEAALALGRHTQITGELATFNAEHGLRDRAARQYALALHRSGRTPEALRVIESHRNTIANESGLEPSPAIVKLEAALLSGDPTLDIDKSGRPLRGYRLLDEIGSGAFSIVWRAMQPSVGREVAVKQIRSELASQPEFIRRFEAEAQMVARIEHHHIVPLIDFWRDPDSAYLVMRWMRGGTLEQRLDRGNLSIAETTQLARQIGSALEVAHNHGVVHRDVKTANILFDEHGNAFLSDFGIALPAVESSGPEAALSQGSPAYSSPEQIRQERLGPQADIFSLGVVLFECLTGELPFSKASSVQELLDQQLHAPYPDLSELRSDVPRSLAAAVAKATAKSSGERFASVADFIEAVETDTQSVSDLAGPPPALGAEVHNPYKGLRAFDSGDADSFFGRERLVSELTSRLSAGSLQSRCLVVVGPSGSGKSSVVRAGLVPALQAGAVPGSDEWFVTTMVPGSDPFESLEAALLRVSVNPPPSLLEQLVDGERGILRSVRRCVGNDEQKVLLVIDQFEEVFIGQHRDRATAFLDGLAAAVMDATSPLRLVVTLRADYYHRPLEHLTFAPIVKGTAVDVTPLAPDELERAITEPARRIGVAFEPGLQAHIAAQSAGQPSPLPLLQYALSELFDRRNGAMLTAAAYEEIGGLTGALAARAESLHDAADLEQKSAMRRLFGHMTSAGEETADLRRRVPIADFEDDPSAMQMLSQLGSARLLTFDRDAATREPTVEVAHEALLREWPRLVGWLAEDREVLRTASDVSLAADAWEDSDREVTDLYRAGRLENAVDLALANPLRLRALDADFIEASRQQADRERLAEQGRLKRLRRLVAGTAVALVLALVAGGVAFVQRNDARSATEQAELATLISRSAAQTVDDPEVALLLALEAHRRSPEAETEQAILNALGSSQFATRASTLGPPWDPETCEGGTSNGITTFGQRGDQLISRNELTGEETEHGPAPASCVYWFADFDANKRWANTPSGTRYWFGPLEGPWEVEKQFNTRHYTLVLASLQSGSFRLIRSTSSGPAVVLIDMSTGDPVGEPITGGPDLWDGWGNGDGSLFAASFGDLGSIRGGESDGQLVIADGLTGEVIHRVLTPTPVTVAAFDDAQNQLVAGTFDGALITIDLETGEIVSTVQHGLTADVIDAEISADGTVMLTSRGAVDWVDRWTGPTGRTAQLRDIQTAIPRPDGKVWTINATGTLFTVIDFEGNALLEQSWDVHPLAFSAFNDGQASILTAEGKPEVINLTTGERSYAVPTRADGSALELSFIYPEVDGLVGVDAEGVVFRSVGDEVVEELDLGAPQWGTRYLDYWALSDSHARGTGLVSLVSLERGAMRVLFSVKTPQGSDGHPTPDGGMLVLLQDGTLRIYDPAGALVSELRTEATRSNLITYDPTSKNMAVSDQDGHTWIVDTSVGETTLATDSELDVDLKELGVTRTAVENKAVVNIGFARGGEILAITGGDGTVRLWDVELNVSVGLVWDGSGANFGSPSWYDEATESIWVNSSGKLLQIPVNPDRWIEKACEVVGRELSAEEWARFVPGNQPQQSACG